MRAAPKPDRATPALSPAERLAELRLTDAQAGAFAAIVAGLSRRARKGRPEGGWHNPAWTRESGLIGAGHAVEVLETLERLGLAEGWRLPPVEGEPGPGPKLWTVSAWGGWLAGKEVREFAVSRGGESIVTPYLADPESPTRPVVMPRQLGHVGMTRPDLLLDPTSIPYRRYEDEEPRDRTPTPYLDPLTGKPMVLFGSIPVNLDKRAAGKAKAVGKPSRRSADAKRAKVVERRRKSMALALAKARPGT